MWFVFTKIAARYHRDVIWVRVMIEVAEIAEGRTLLSKAFEQIVSDSGLIVLIFEYDDEHVIEMLWRRWGTGSGGYVLRKTESRDGPNEKRFPCKNAAVPAPGRHVPSTFPTVLELRRRSPLEKLHA